MAVGDDRDLQSPARWAVIVRKLNIDGDDQADGGFMADMTWRCTPIRSSTTPSGKRNWGVRSFPGSVWRELDDPGTQRRGGTGLETFPNRRPEAAGHAAVRSFGEATK